MAPSKSSSRPQGIVVRKSLLPARISTVPPQAPHPPARNQALILPFSQVSLDDIPRVGGKNASLGEMVRELTPQGIHVPEGFAITSAAYQLFLKEAGCLHEIQNLLAQLQAGQVESIRQNGARIRQLILQSSIPKVLADAISQAYTELGGPAHTSVDVAVRSSATAEDLPSASFAGQQETYLNVRGTSELLHCCLRCFASLYTDRAISYRLDQGFAHDAVALSIGVQKMVRSDLGTSGVLFTLDTESGFRDVVLINAAYGLGENVVQGSVNPDEFYVFKPTLKQGRKPILQRKLGSKELKMVYDVGGSRMVRNIPVPEADRQRFCITDEDVLQLARWACILEDHYSARHGHDTPMDIEWAKDGITGELFIVQARPETVQSCRSTKVMEHYHLQERGPVLVSGRSVGEKIAAGPVRIIPHAESIHEFRAGEVLVTDKTDPDWEPIMKKAAAIVTNRGGRTCHAAIVSRELGVPAVVGTGNATEILRPNQEVTVSCAEGDTGWVYQGILPFQIQQTQLQDLPRPRTAVMMNIANPDEAFALRSIPNDGVGLARMEFIIANSIRIHPLALVHFDQLQPGPTRTQIENLTHHYTRKEDYFVDKLAEGIAMITAAFHPKDVILRLSDFKTNEYANLIGGRDYEPTEENPMLGFRGASRYYHPRYQAGFALECRAVRKVREEMGLTNLKIMIPFCRTVEEGRKVQDEMASHGLIRGRNGLEIYVMCEIPSNVILAEAFAEIFDGFSIGSNDLTQLVLGVDRDSEIVAPIFDERNPAVQNLIAQVIQTCRKKGRKIGICGQAPSDYPEFAQFLVDQGIHSISLNPDTVLKTTMAILNRERSLALNS